MNRPQPPSRISSLNPFEAGTITADPTTPGFRIPTSVTPHEVLDEVEGFGCVDWYLYPNVRGRRQPATGVVAK